MTKRLEEAIAEASKLPNQHQDTLATIILEEIAAQERWDIAFSSSQEQLTKLADEALAEFRQNKTKPMEKRSFSS